MSFSSMLKTAVSLERVPIRSGLKLMVKMAS